jgi:hypothetical protein
MIFQFWHQQFYSPFCVQAKIIKLVGLKNGGRLSPINLVTFAGTQNGELKWERIVVPVT